MYIDKIPDTAKQIKNSFDFIDIDGKVYGIENRNNNKHKGQPFIKTLHTIYGYKYCGIRYKNGKVISKRVHRLVAEAFIPNPNNYPIVMHKDNNKKNNHISNLKWGTVSNNTQQAVDDKLLVNKKGFEDNQSIPCECYDSLTNKHIGTFGSISIASQEMNITKGGILYQINNPDKPIRKSFYFTKYGESPKKHDIICQYDFNTDKEINRFISIGKASEITKISQNTISEQIKNGSKPKWSKTNTYFLKLQLL